MYIQRKRIYADEELDTEVDVTEEGAGGASVDPEASELLFQAEDVAELVAEVTGDAVEVTVDDDTVVFAVGDDEYTVEPEGDEEVLMSATRLKKNRRPVAASTVRSTSTTKKATVKRVPRRGR